MEKLSFKQWIDAIYALFTWTIVMAGVGLIFFQIIQWLRFGEWVPLSVLWALQKLHFHVGWVGVAKILDNIPLSLTLCFLGIGLMCVFFKESKEKL